MCASLCLRASHLGEGPSTPQGPDLTPVKVAIGSFKIRLPKKPSGFIFLSDPHASRVMNERFPSPLDREGCSLSPRLTNEWAEQLSATVFFRNSRREGKRCAAANF